MKQIVQNYKTGELNILDVPVPQCKAGGVLVKTINSLISIGTEKSMIDIARKSLLGKASARPDLVKRCIDKAKKEGFVSVYKEAMNRLDEPVALGYSSAGVITAVGSGVSGFMVGDRVACAGAGFASHAELVWVPENLCVHLPGNVSFEEASFVMLGGIALEGIRTAHLTFGENVVVVGLGLLGLMTANMLHAYGCNVIGIDINEKKIDFAKKMGVRLGLVLGKDDIAAAVENFTQSYGADAVIITASSKDNAPLELAENICRKKGNIVLVGVTDIQLTRKSFWEKELSFAVSKAAGPGSIEPLYEQAGYDYPIQYVRWTEKRNLEHFIDLLSQKKVSVDKFITHRFGIAEALSAYQMIMGGKEYCVGVVLEYPAHDGIMAETMMPLSSAVLTKRFSRNIGVIGGGMFTKNILLPALKKVVGVGLKGISTTTGMTSAHLGKKYKFEYATSDYRKILDDAGIDGVVVTTRHNSHCRMVTEALAAGKHVFVEKPLCMTEDELREVRDAYRSGREKKLKLMVGFNRRFSTLASQAKEVFRNRRTPLVMVYRVNAGYIPKDHWTQDPAVGGGRIIGEVCHFIDLLQYINDSHPVSVFAETIAGETGKYLAEDNVLLHIKFADGTIGTIIYAANGAKSFSRERVEIFGEDSIAVIDDFKTLTTIKNGSQKNRKLMSQDMGYQAELDHFVNATNFEADKLFEGYVYTTLATLKAVESYKKGVPLTVSI